MRGISCSSPRSVERYLGRPSGLWRRHVDAAVDNRIASVRDQKATACVANGAHRSQEALLEAFGPPLQDQLRPPMQCNPPSRRPPASCAPRRAQSPPTTPIKKTLDAMLAGAKSSISTSLHSV